MTDPEPIDLPDVNDATQNDLISRVMSGDLTFNLGASHALKIRNSTPQHRARWAPYLASVGVAPTLSGAGWAGLIALVGAFDDG
jgi:hypothetical protein